MSQALTPRLRTPSALSPTPFPARGRSSDSSTSRFRDSFQTPLWFIARSGLRLARLPNKVLRQQENAMSQLQLKRISKEIIERAEEALIPPKGLPKAVDDYFVHRLK